jgi:hypothetical protein
MARAADAGVVAVAYADADRVGSLDPASVVEAASRAGAVGVLVDTADKSGPGLRALMNGSALDAWIDAAHRRKLLVAVAGQLTALDLDYVRESGADIAGVRGAACEGGRKGYVSADKVRALHDNVNSPTHQLANLPTHQFFSSI